MGGYVRHGATGELGAWGDEDLLRRRLMRADLPTLGNPMTTARTGRGLSPRFRRLALISVLNASAALRTCRHMPRRMLSVRSVPGNETRKEIWVPSILKGLAPALNTYLLQGPNDVLLAISSAAVPQDECCAKHSPSLVLRINRRVQDQSVLEESPDSSEKAPRRGLGPL